MDKKTRRKHLARISLLSLCFFTSAIGAAVAFVFLMSGAISLFAGVISIWLLAISALMLFKKVAQAMYRLDNEAQAGLTTMSSNDEMRACAESVGKAIKSNCP